MENVGNEHSKVWFFKVSRDPGDHTPKPLRIITPTHAKSSLGIYASFWYPKPHTQEKGGNEDEKFEDLHDKLHIQSITR